MRIALFSDVHANLPAFKAFLESLDVQKPDASYCLGDLVGYNIWPNEIIDEIRQRKIATIAGNHDVKAQKLTSLQLMEPGPNYAYKLITAANRDYLADLPAHFRLEFQINNRPLHVLLVHGSPNSNEEYLLVDKPEQDFLEIFKQTNTDILCFGHSHKPYHRVFNTTSEKGNRFRHAINVGSVGKPKDGTSKGCYVILTLHHYSNTSTEESIDVNFIRFDYDVEKAAKAVENSPLPNEYADMLRNGY